MKTLIISLLLLSSPAFAGMYVQGGLGSGSEVRVGYQGAWDLSYGLFNSNELKTVSVEAYKVLPYKDVLFKLGAGAGFTIPHITDRKGDNDLSGIIGGKAEYKLTNSLSIEGSVRGIFFNTKTRKTFFGSHVETLSNGMEAEILDTYHSYDSENLNHAVGLISLRWSF